MRMVRMQAPCAKTEQITDHATWEETRKVANENVET